MEVLEASMEVVEASMEVMEASMEAAYVEASICRVIPFPVRFKLPWKQWKLPRKQWKASIFYGIGSFCGRSLWKLP